MRRDREDNCDGEAAGEAASPYETFQGGRQSSAGEEVIGVHLRS